jgi:hypothetical protein
MEVVLVIEAREARICRLASEAADQFGVAQSTQPGGFIDEELVTGTARAPIFGVAVQTVLVEVFALDAFPLLGIGGVHFAACALVPSRAHQALLIELAALEAGLVLEEVLLRDAFGAVVDARARVAGGHGLGAVLAVVVGDVELGVALETGLLGAVHALLVVDRTARADVLAREVVVVQAGSAGSTGAYAAVLELISAQSTLLIQQVISVCAFGAPSGIAGQASLNHSATLAQPTVNIKLLLAGSASILILAFSAVVQRYAAQVAGVAVGVEIVGITDAREAELEG